MQLGYFLANKNEASLPAVSRSKAIIIHFLFGSGIKTKHAMAPVHRKIPNTKPTRATQRGISRQM